MFDLFKKKLKAVVNSISKKIEQEAPEDEEEAVITEQKAPQPEQKKTFFSTLFTRDKKTKETPEQKPPLPPSPQEPLHDDTPHPPAPKTVETSKPVPHPTHDLPAKEQQKSIFRALKEKIVTKRITEEAFSALFLDLELALLENNTAVDVIDKIKTQLKTDIVDHPIPRGKVVATITNSLKKSISSLFNVPPLNILDLIRKKKEKPFVILFVGVNGSGKTTTIAKFAHFLKKNHLTSVLAAADTFRAGSIAQLDEWARHIHLPIIKHDYGSDPAAVSYDAIDYAQKQHIDVVLIDTAGRQHTNINLVRQMEKIVRVAHPDLKIFVGESITGNDCIIQAREFDDAIHLDGIILTKADVDEKGGTALSVTYVTGKPVLYLGIGQALDSLEPFDKEKIIHNLGL